MADWGDKGVDRSDHQKVSRRRRGPALNFQLQSSELTFKTCYDTRTKVIASGQDNAQVYHRTCDQYMQRHTNAG